MTMFINHKQLIRFVLLNLWSCSLLMAQDDSSFLAYQKMIVNTQKKVVDLTALTDLFQSPEFLAIYTHPELHVDNTIKLLKKKDVTEDQKIIAAYGMRRLSLNAYMGYLNALLPLASTGTITRQVFEEAAFPEVEWSPTFYESYKVPAVNAFLVKAKKLAQSKKWDLVAYIDSALSGELARSVQQAREMGDIPTIKKK